MIRTEQTDLLVGHQVHVGEYKRDSHAIVHFQPIEHGQPAITLAVVAHGMWSIPAGREKTAADIVVDTFVEKYTEATSPNIQATFSEAVAAASHKIRQYRETHPETEAVIASCAATLIMNSRLYTVSVGNCRIYFLRKRQLRQISADHTTIQMMIDRGYVTENEQKNGHWDGFPFTRCLGGEPDMISQYEVPDFRLRLHNGESDKQAQSNQGLLLTHGDEVMLCTDGLHGSINTLARLKNESIRKVWLSQSHPQQTADALITLAKQTIGEYWDITAIVVKVP
jgi:PPM family protein phosphatase